MSHKKNSSHTICGLKDGTHSAWQVEELGLDPSLWLLAQGTIYPDTIESGGTKNAAKIKTHHNRVPQVQLYIYRCSHIGAFIGIFKCSHM